MRIAVVFLSVLVLTGCVGSDPPMAPAPTPTSTPLFASDEEALKAAEAAYKAYRVLSDRVLSEGGANADRLAAVETGSLLKENVEGFNDAKQKGLRGIGNVTFDQFKIESITGGKRPALWAYVCEDVSLLQLVDSHGVSTVSPSRPNRTLYEVSFDLVGDQRLLLSHKEAWSGAQC
jgi:hypothetical protein